MKKLLVFLFLLALTLPGCAAPAASQPGTTQPQTQTAPQTTQPQEKDVWEWMQELAPHYDFSKEPYLLSAYQLAHIPKGRSFGESIEYLGTPVRAQRTAQGLILTYKTYWPRDFETARFIFTPNPQGELVLSQMENVLPIRNDLTREDFADVTVDKTTVLELFNKVGMYHSTQGSGNIYYLYYLTTGERVAFKFASQSGATGQVIRYMDFWPVIDQEDFYSSPIQLFKDDTHSYKDLKQVQTTCPEAENGAHDHLVPVYFRLYQPNTPQSYYASVMEQAKYLPWLAPADTVNCCELAKANGKTEYFVPLDTFRAYPDFSAAGHSNGQWIRVKISEEFSFKDFERQVFFMAEKGLPLPEDLSRLEGVTEGRREILWEDKVFIYQDGKLKWIVFQRENGLIALEYSDAPAILQSAKAALEKIQNGTADENTYVSEAALYLMSSQWHQTDPNWGRSAWQGEAGGEPVTLEQYLLSCLDGLSLGPILYK